MRMCLKIFFLVALWHSVVTGSQYHDIRSPQLTNYGNWHDWSMCPDNKYAAGLQVKAEGDQRGRDDTGLNVVSLYCLPLNWQDLNRDNWIMSGEGEYGTWGGIKWCPKGQSIIGFALRSEPDQRGKDDVAADNFAGYCGYPSGRRGRTNWIQGDTEGWGDWTADQWCPEDYLVCGIQSQIEPPQGGHDDTSLNNVNLRCCKVTSAQCKAAYRMEVIFEYDNRRGPGEITGSYKVKTSVTRTTSESRSVSQSEKWNVGAKVTATFGVESPKYKAGGSVEVNTGYEKLNAETVTRLVQDVVQRETEKTLTIKVPSGKKAVVKQLVFTCGEFSLLTPKTVVHQ